MDRINDTETNKDDQSLASQGMKADTDVVMSGASNKMVPTLLSCTVTGNGNGLKNKGKSKGAGSKSLGKKNGFKMMRL